jgi:hypothetical protein
MDKDIEKLRRVLRHKNREDLRDLFRFSYSNLVESGSYGSMLFSVKSTFEIYSHPSTNEELLALPYVDKQVILDSVLQIYPRKENCPEITWIEYYPDFDTEYSEILEVKELERISFEYIHEQIKKCNDKIQDKDFEGSVTNARNLIESICLYILESRHNKKQEYDGNLLKLYKTVSLELKMSPSNYADENLKQILSGIFSIINGVSGLRNNFSDSHGSSPIQKKYKIDERHAILTVNLAKTISEYLFLCHEKK